MVSPIFGGKVDENKYILQIHFLRVPLKSVFKQRTVKTVNTTQKVVNPGLLMAIQDVKRKL